MTKAPKKIHARVPQGYDTLCGRDVDVRWSEDWDTVTCATCRKYIAPLLK